MNCIHCNHKIDGEAFISGESALHQKCLAEYNRHQAGLYYECPKCETSGKIDDPSGRTHTETVALAYGETPSCAYDGCYGCGHCRNNTKSVTVTNKVVCNLCNGKGWLTKKPEPITKIVDWKIP